MSTEQIYAALFALVSQGEGEPGTITWGDGCALTWTSRRVKMWGDLPSQPALCQAEHDEMVSNPVGVLPTITLGASWLIYLNDGQDPNAIPAQTTNAVLDAIKALFPLEPDNAQTLGGLVYRAAIDGKIQKFQGDLDGQTLLVVPIKMISTYPADAS